MHLSYLNDSVITNWLVMTLYHYHPLLLPSPCRLPRTLIMITWLENESLHHFFTLEWLPSKLLHNSLHDHLTVSWLYTYDYHHGQEEKTIQSEELPLFELRAPSHLLRPYWRTKANIHQEIDGKRWKEEILLLSSFVLFIFFEEKMKKGRDLGSLGVCTPKKIIQQRTRNLFF